jgi:protein TonB
METPPPAQAAPQPAKAAPEATQHAKESPALDDGSTAAPSASETPPVAAPGPALSDLLAAARRYSEAPEVRRLGPATVLSPAEDAYLRGWRTRIERLGTGNFPPEARRAAERAGGQATLRLRAELFRDGRLGDLAVVIGSGDAAVDQAALTLVRSAHPYLPFPQALSRHERLEIVRDFTFRLPSRHGV